MILRGCREAKQVFRHSVGPAALAVPFVAPLKLSITYVALMPVLAAWLWRTGSKLTEKIRSSRLTLPFFLFLACTAVSALFGRHALHSLRGMPTLLLFALLMLMMRDASRRYTAPRIICALLCGQAIAAFQSLIETGSPVPVRHIFIGAVTESGQIALTLVAGLAALWYYAAQANPAELRAGALSVYGRGALHFLLFAMVAFAPSFHLPAWLFFALALTAAWPAARGIGALLSFVTRGGAPALAIHRVLAACVLPLVTVALLAHLKRGPWIGVLTGATLFIFMYRRRLVLPVLIAVAALFLALAPIRARLQHSAEDFYISGGRSIMWRVGAEMAARYPLGIGYANSKYLREFSPDIPPEHNHFHNNFLNVLVEAGWVSFAVFLWWFVFILRLAFRNRWASTERLLAAGIGCAVVSLLVAGTVEYNFGDSEVMMILFVLLGLLEGLEDQREEEAGAGRPSVAELQASGG